jgi:uncharacterized membrane protein YqjE
MSGEEPPSPGLFRSLRSLAASAVALAHTRLELFGTELQEALAQLVLGLVYAVGALLLAALGLGFGGVAILIAAAEHRLQAAVILAVILLALAGIGAWLLHRLVFQKLRLFQASLAELNADWARLKGKTQGNAERTD